MDNRQPEISRQTRDENCDVHGPFTATNYFRDRWSTCSACAKLESEQHESDKLAAERRDRSGVRQMRSGLRGRFADISFASYIARTPDQVAVLATCRAYAEDFSENSGGLWLLGKPGTGKTHLGSAIVNVLIRDRDMPAMLYSGRELIRLLRSTWGDRPQPSLGWVETSHRGSIEVRHPETETEMIDMLGAVPLLVIDEIGVQFGTDAETVQLFDIIDRRYTYMRPTVILSNLTAPEMKNVLGDRAYDRLREGSKVLNCKWASHRGASDSDRA